eukprot:scaffold11885_cov129-Isochrysis_galbana.AAC.4
MARAVKGCRAVPSASAGSIRNNKAAPRRDWPLVTGSHGKMHWAARPERILLTGQGPGCAGRRKARMRGWPPCIRARSRQQSPEVRRRASAATPTPVAHMGPPGSRVSGAQARTSGRSTLCKPCRGSKVLQAHLLWWAFKEAATTQSEERISNKGDVGVGKVIGHVTLGVPTHIKHHAERVTKLEAVSTRHGYVNLADLGRLRARRDHLAPGSPHQLSVATSVVRVVVRVQNVGQLPATSVERVQNGTHLWRVDRSRRTRRLIMHEEPVIIPQAGKLLNNQASTRVGDAPAACPDMHGLA